MKAEHRNVEWSQIVARAWQDAAFKQRLLADPAAVLREHGLHVPPDIEVKVVEDTAQVYHLTLPRRPDAAGELSAEALAGVAGGAGGHTILDGDPCAGGKFKAR